jgi:heme exporter protein B
MRALAALIWKDLVIEARTRELVTSMGLVAFLALVILNLALAGSPRLAPGTPAAAAPAAVWVTVSFAATLGLARAHALEHEGRAIEGVLATPVSRSILYLGKCGANLTVVLALQLVVVAATAVLFSGSFAGQWPWLAPPLLLGALGFTAIGTLLGAITAATRLREVLLPILLLPTALPVIVLSLAGMQAVLDGRGLTELLRSLKLLAAVDIIFLMLGIWLFPYVVEE